MHISPRSRGVGICRLPDAQVRFRLEALETRLLLDGAAPAFVTEFDSHYFLGDPSLAIGLEASDADISGVLGDTLTYSVVSQTPGVTAEIVSQANRYVALHFTAADGLTDIGAIVVQLFEDRSPTATERFITLAVNGFDEDGQIDPNAPPFYTDVVVHRVIPDFMIQTGDAVKGDGTGGSPLGTFPDEFDPDLRFGGAGVVAFANSGPDTNDCQFFITAGPTTWLDGGYFIFGQMVSAGVNPATGQSTYDTIINTETDPTGEGSRPLDPPLLQSVEIFTADIASGRYATVLVRTDGTFSGQTTLTLTVTDQQGNQTSQDLPLTVPETRTVRAVSGVEKSFYMNFTGVTDPVVSSIDGVACSFDARTWLVTVKAPEGYNGAFNVTLYDSDTEMHKVLVISQEAGAPSLTGEIPYSEAPVMCSVQAGNLLYAGLSEGGIAIYDISDPAEPVSLGSLAYSHWDGSQLSEAFNSISDMKLKGGTLYVLDTDLESVGRLTSVDVSDPSGPMPIDSVQTAEIPYSLGISGNRAFVADLDVGLTSYDISDPANLKKYNSTFTTLPSGLTIAQISAVAVKGQYAYCSTTLKDAAAGNYGALVVVNVANPANMTFAGAVGTYLPIGLDIEGDRLFAMEWLETGSANSRLSAYDLSSPTRPKYLSSVKVPGDGWQLDVIGDKAVAVPRNGTSVTLLDVGDPLHMHVNYTFTNDAIASGETSWGYKPSQSSGLAAVPIENIGTMLFNLVGLTEPVWVDAKTTFPDENGTPVTVSISGGGSVKVTTSGDNSGHIQSLEVFPAGATTKVVVTTPYGKVTGADEIVIHGSAGSFVAKTINLTGNMTVEGVLKTLALGGISAGAVDIDTLDLPTASTTPTVSVTLGVVSDVRMNTHGLAVKSLTASQWLDGDGNADNDALTVPRLGRLAIKGEFQAGLSVLGTGGTQVLGSAKIGGGASGAWSITGDAGKISIGGQADGLRVSATGSIAALVLGAAKDSSFLAGFPLIFSDTHPGSSADFDLSMLSSIGSIKITGLAIPKGSLIPRFVDNVTFSAARIGPVRLRNVDPSDCGLYSLAGGALSGIASVKVADSDPLWRLDAAYNWRWAPTSPFTPEIIHLL